MLALSNQKLKLKRNTNMQSNTSGRKSPDRHATHLGEKRLTPCTPLANSAYQPDTLQLNDNPTHHKFTINGGNPANQNEISSRFDQSQFDQSKRDETSRRTGGSRPRPSQTHKFICQSKRPAFTPPPTKALRVTKLPIKTTPHHDSTNQNATHLGVWGLTPYVPLMKSTSSPPIRTT